MSLTRGFQKQLSVYVTESYESIAYGYCDMNDDNISNLGARLFMRFFDSLSVEKKEQYRLAGEKKKKEVERLRAIRAKFKSVKLEK